MEVNIRSTFTKDAKKLSDDLKGEVADAIHFITNAEKLSDIPHVQSLKGVRKQLMLTGYELKIIAFVFTSKIRLLSW